MEHLTQYVNYLVAMFAITNPFGNLAIFIGLAADRTAKQRRKIIRTMVVAVIIIMTITTWLGDLILKAFGISVSAFQVAGGIVILLIGLSMLQAKETEMAHSDEEKAEAEAKDSVAVVPLALPLIAGPGTMTTMMVTVHQYSSTLDKTYLSIVNVIVTLFIGIIFSFSGPIAKMLGVSGIKIATRIMGLILMAMAAQMLLVGLHHVFVFPRSI